MVRGDFKGRSGVDKEWKHEQNMRVANIGSRMLDKLKVREEV